MRNLLIIICICPILVIGQSKERGKQQDTINFCSTNEYMKEMFKKYPEMKRKHEQLDSILKDINDGKMKIANFEDTTVTKEDTLNKKTKNKYRMESTEEVIPWVVRIPVVVHVVYKNATENISDTQIQSQITALNQHFRRLNASAANTPSAFTGVARDARLEFCLATIDPNGNPTNGITRTSTSVQKFTTNDLVKNSTSGGKDIWNRNNYLNIWVCDLDGGGYAQFPAVYAPSGFSTAAATDGVVMSYMYFGTTGTTTLAGYTQGTITVHEVGHWLGLYHIFGNGNGNDCSDDGVNDTPLQTASQFNCSTFPKVTCNNGSNGGMFMNYMDYSNGDCMNMFTAGQRDRMMNAIYVSRNIFSTYNNILVDGNPIPSDNYGSNKSLTSIGKVNSGSTVNFRSGDMVRLQPGFRANQGSSFRATANQCVCSGSLSNITQHNPYKISVDSNYSKSYESVGSKQRILNIYPNPTSSKSATIDYKVFRKGMVRIYIMNSLGIHIKDLVFEYNHSIGNFSTEANLAEFSSGLYYIAVKDYSGYDVKKLVVE